MALGMLQASCSCHGVHACVVVCAWVHMQDLGFGDLGSNPTPGNLLAEPSVRSLSTSSLRESVARGTTSTKSGAACMRCPFSITNTPLPTKPGALSGSTVLIHQPKGVPC